MRMYYGSSNLGGLNPEASDRRMHPGNTGQQLPTATSRGDTSVCALTKVFFKNLPTYNEKAGKANRFQTPADFNKLG